MVSETIGNGTAYLLGWKHYSDDPLLTMGVYGSEDAFKEGYERFMFRENVFMAEVPLNAPASPVCWKEVPTGPMGDNEFFTVFTKDGKKYIERYGYFYTEGEDAGCDGVVMEWRFVDTRGHPFEPGYTANDWCICDQNADIYDLIESDAYRQYQRLYSEARPLPIKAVDGDTPDGFYLDDGTGHLGLEWED